MGEDKDRGQFLVIGTPDHDVGGLAGLRDKERGSLEERIKCGKDTVDIVYRDLSQLAQSRNISLRPFVNVDGDQRPTSSL